MRSKQERIHGVMGNMQRYSISSEFYLATAGSILDVFVLLDDFYFVLAWYLQPILPFSISGIFSCS